MSFNFDGVDERLDWSSVQNLAATALTISVWVYWDAETASAFQYFLNIQNVDDTSRSIILCAWQNTGVSRALWFQRVGTTNLYRRTAGDAFAGSQWVHILGTHNGTFTDYTGMHIYVGGAEVTYQANQNGATETAPSGKWCIGGRTYDATCVTDGRIAEVGVWDRVLNSTEIANLASGYAPSLISTDLIYYFSGKSDTLVAEVGGTGTAAGGAVYNSAHPTINYGEGETLSINIAPATSRATGVRVYP